jgi:hypothetical protein
MIAYLSEEVNFSQYYLVQLSGISTNQTIDLSAVFGVPAGVKGVEIRISASDSAADAFGSLQSADGEQVSTIARTQTANQYNDGSGSAPCDANGDVCFRCNLSPAIFLQIHGYAI